MEHLANQVLREHGIEAAHTEIVETERRTYLRSLRFDRLGHGGKRHLVAATAVHEAFVPGSRMHWVAICEALFKSKMIAIEGLNTVALAFFFGQNIGNTDMHFGNLSFFVQDLAKPRFEPTPAYDMLPMRRRPSIHDGDLEATPVRPQSPIATQQAAQAQARLWAIEFWERAETMATLSQPIRTACGESAQRLRTNFAGAW